MAYLAENDIEGSTPESLLASQWGERSRGQFLEVPERKLLVAVLVDAVRILLGNDRRERAGVLRWIKGDDARIPFRELCHNLELDPAATARQLVGFAPARREDARRVSTRRVASIRRRDSRQPAGVGNRRLPIPDGSEPLDSATDAA